MPRQPKYCHHKATGQAYVTINGKPVYLGKYNSPASRDRYDEELLKWTRQHDVSGKHTTTVGQLCLEFLKHAETFYRDPSGKPTKEANNFRQSLRRLVSMFRAVPCAQFGPAKLRALQVELEKQHCRTQVNKHVSRIRSVFRWGVAHEIVPVDVVTALECVKGLQAGRCQAKESDPVQPVPQEDVDKALPEMSTNVAAMVRLQLLTGARPSEIRLMRVGDIETSGDVWHYRPNVHKNAWRGKSRTILIGPRGQAVLLPFVSDAVRRDQFVFRPKAKHNRPYTLTGYISSIQKACAKAEVSAWSPGQLRHTTATAVKQRYGDIDGARVVLGHSEKTTTQIYAARDLTKAAEIIREIG